MSREGEGEGDSWFYKTYQQIGRGSFWKGSELEIIRWNREIQTYEIPSQVDGIWMSSVGSGGPPKNEGAIKIYFRLKKNTVTIAISSFKNFKNLNDNFSNYMRHQGAVNKT